MSACGGKLSQWATGHSCLCHHVGVWRPSTGSVHALTSACRQPGRVSVCSVVSDLRFMLWICHQFPRAKRDLFFPESRPSASLILLATPLQVKLKDMPGGGIIAYSWETLLESERIRTRTYENLSISSTTGLPCPRFGERGKRLWFNGAGIAYDTMR